jgi:hypothetical protein
VTAGPGLGGRRPIGLGRGLAFVHDRTAIAKPSSHLSLSSVMPMPNAW